MLHIDEAVERGARAHTLSNALNEWSEENSVPIRYVAQTELFAITRDYPWTDAQVAGCCGEYSEDALQLCTSRGVTIVSLGCSSYPEHRSFNFFLDAQAINGFTVPSTTAPADYRITITDTSDVVLNVGEVTPYVIYDHIGVLRFPVRTQRQFIQQYLDAVATCITDDFEQTVLDRRHEQALRSLRAYQDTILESRTEIIRENISRIEATMLSHQRSVDMERRRLQQEHSILESVMLLNTNDGADQIVEDFEALFNHPRVTDAVFNGMALSITTTDDFRITRPDTGESRWLGSFKITIDLSMFDVSIINLSTPRYDRQHPHINGTTPCFGGHHDDFTQLLQNGQLLMFFELLCQYLETLNLQDSWGAFGAYWFDVPDERPIEVAA